MRLLCCLLFALVLLPTSAHAFDQCIQPNGYHLPCPTGLTVAWNDGASVTIGWTQVYNHVTRTYVYPYPVRTNDPTYVPIAVLPAPSPGYHTAVDRHPLVGQSYVIYEMYENGIDGNNGITTESITPATPLRPALWLPLVQ
jgi:hypothetical protein